MSVMWQGRVGDHFPYADFQSIDRDLARIVGQNEVHRAIEWTYVRLFF
jgi:hypothetical protein